MVYGSILVASSRDGTFLLSALLTVAYCLGPRGRVAVISQDFGVVVCQYSSHVWQASIANFDSVSVNYSMEWVAYGEIFVHQREKFLPYIGLDI